MYTSRFGVAIVQNKWQLKSHAYEIKKNIYTVEDWEAITAILEQGKAAINATAGYGEIKSAFDTAIAAMDAVELTVAIEEDIYNTIKQDYYEEYGKEFWFSRFYGFHNGAAVFFLLGMDNIEKAITISGVELSFYNSDWTILVYKDGIFYDLEDIAVIFNAGVLSQADLEAIGEVNARPESKWPNGLGRFEGLGIEDELLIKKTFYNTTQYFMYESFDCYYGMYDGYVVFSRFPYSTFWGFYREIDGLVFYFSEPFGGIYVGKEGGYSDLDLKGLYENGVINLEELQNIYLQYLEYYHDKEY